MAGANTDTAQGGKQKLLSTAGWPVERWVAVIVFAALVLLIAIRRGFRGVNLLGVKAGVS